MNVLFFIGTSPFPFGSASASRLRNLTRALLEQGITVQVASMARLPDRPADNDNGVRSFSGVQYESIMGYYLQVPSRRGLEGKLYGYLDLLLAAWKSRRLVGQLLDSGKIDAIVLYGWTAIELEPISILARSKGIPVFSDITEWRDRSSIPGGIFNPLFLPIIRTYRKTHWMSDAIIAISSAIEKRFVDGGKEVLRIPAVVDPALFPEIPVATTPLVPFRLLYLGYLREQDDPNIMIEAVRLTITRGYPVMLEIVGTGGRNGLAKQIRNRCETDSVLRGCVKFLGPVSDQNNGYLAFLQQANALILLRNDLPFVRNGFPTRLPELLLSGRPLITSRVDDVPQFVKDDVHAVIARAGDAEDVSRCIIKLIENPAMAREVGRMGRQRALDVFNYHSYGPQLAAFIHKYTDKQTNPF